MRTGIEVALFVTRRAGAETLIVHRSPAQGSYWHVIAGDDVKVHYTLTSMGCPAGPMIQEDIHRVALEVPGVENVEIELTWDPPWTPEKMSDDAKFILGFG